MSMERRTREGARPLPLLQWSVQDVVVWLNSLKLSIDYSSLFKGRRERGGLCALLELERMREEGSDS